MKWPRGSIARWRLEEAQILCAGMSFKYRPQELLEKTLKYIVSEKNHKMYKEKATMHERNI